MVSIPLLGYIFISVEVETPSLQSLCRAVIRNILRKNVELEHPPVKRKIPAQRGPKKKRVLKRLVVPLFESEDSSDDDRHIVRLGGVSLFTEILYISSDVIF